MLARLQELRSAAQRDLLIVGNGAIPNNIDNECQSSLDEVLRFNDFGNADHDKKTTIHVVNSIVERPVDDAWLISMRHQDAVAKISRSGEIVWILGNHDNWAPSLAPYGRWRLERGT